ncbi:MAG: DUF1295 domain-containing protein [Hyphomicrobium sp.]
MQLLKVLFWSATVLSLTMLLAWLLALQVKNAGWADTFWTMGIGCSSLTSIVLFASKPLSSRPFLVMILAACWSGRLAHYLYSRTRNSPEDARYAYLRKEWGVSFTKRLFFFLQLQALAALPLVFSIVVAADRLGPLDICDFLGTGLFFIGLMGTTLSDRQLAAFKANPENTGLICNNGLWKASRHPNYFFEWLTWCSWPILAFSLSGNYYTGVFAMMAPLLMYYLLVYVSGLPLLEAHMERTRPSAFALYKKETPIFFPNFLKFMKPSSIGAGSLK